jgi:carboxypeptidase Q
MIRKYFAALSLTALAIAMPASAQVDETNRLVDEGMSRSQVMSLAQEMTDDIGPRLTNSPAMRRAEAWAIDKFTGWGLQNVRRDAFDFGRGWEIVSSSARMTVPRPLQLTAIPVAWTPPTNGVLSGEVIVAPMSKLRHFDEWKGKLAGKIVMISMPGTGSEPDKAAFRRWTSEELGKLDAFDQPEYDPEELNARLKRVEFVEKLDAFLKAEGAIGWVRMSYRDGKLVHGAGYNFRNGRTLNLPGIELSAEDYRRLVRLTKTGRKPVIEFENNVRFDDSDRNGYNIIAEIPGSDPKAGYVMAGAHFDSWVAGDGATDNAAGSAVVMEAARILKRMGTPKRTIRFALWSGEEQGLIGSRAYTEKYLARREPKPGTDPNGLEAFYDWTYRYPIIPQPGYNDLKAYFNMDNGSGKFRGIYAEGNAAAVPLLKEWLSPFAGMDASRVVAADTSGTDHVFMTRSITRPAPTTAMPTRSTI